MIPAVTIEHSVIVGLDDIKAVIFECRGCKTRLVMSPDSASIPHHCPKQNCDVMWLSGKASGITNDYEGTSSAFLNLISAIEFLRKRNGGFRVLFEFRDERSASSS